MNGLALLLLVASSRSAPAQTATNLTTTRTYSSLQTAVTEATPGDTVEVDGAFVETVTIGKDLTLVSASGGGSIRSTGAAAVILGGNVDVTLDGVDLVGDGSARVLSAPSGGDTLTVRNAVLTAPTTFVGNQGGMLRLDQPDDVTLDSVTLTGTAGLEIASSGGAIWVNAGTQLELVDVHVKGIETSGSGGGVYAFDTDVTCLRCTFEDTHGGQGGAMHLSGGGTLLVEQSSFCGTQGTLGGAIFASDDTEIRASVFHDTSAENGGAIYANGGAWSVVNNHVLQTTHHQTLPIAGSVHANALVTSLEIRNNLFDGNGPRALGIAAGVTHDVAYNWFYDNDADANVGLGATNDTSGTSPQLASGTCVARDQWPVAITSPLIDAGDPKLSDPDGSRSDIGAFGGSSADPAAHVDSDGDGVGVLSDCDDDDATVGGRAAFFPDCDEDGQGATGTAPRLACEPPSGRPLLCPAGRGTWASSALVGPLANADCNDQVAQIHSGAIETCDDVDRDCDGDPYLGAVDAPSRYVDADHDGFGAGAPFLDCTTVVPGWVDVDGDCDDADPATHPGAVDWCGDGVDRDCSGADGVPGDWLEWFVDADGDGFGDPSSAPLTDCAGLGPPGRSPNDRDCDDTRRGVSPRAPERCTGFDDDCNGAIDDVGPARTWYADPDGDGVGDPDIRVVATCPPDPDWSTVPARAASGCGCSTPRVPPGGSGLGLLLLLAWRRRCHAECGGAA